jgi:hypothetical protein
MTASEANHHRVITLLASEREQMDEQSEDMEKNAPARRRGRQSTITDSFAQPYNSEQVGTLPTSESVSNNPHPLPLQVA